MLSARDVKADARAINDILWRDWDPISGAPADEYDSHVWPLYRLLLAGAPRAEVEAHLRRAAQALQCPVPDERLQRTLDRLYALKLHSGREP